jgi:hypothetical protein
VLTVALLAAPLPAAAAKRCSSKELDELATAPKMAVASTYFGGPPAKETP